MTQKTVKTRQSGNAYNIFIFVLTVLSLAVMVGMVIPWFSQQTKDLLNYYDNIICVIFLIDFTLNILGSSPKSAYFIKERGWLDLLGSIPSFGFFQFSGLLRLFRISRLARITRLMREQNKKQLVDDVMKNRGQYATFITILLAILVLTVASVVVLQFESTDPNANIQTGWDSFWFSIVTITTVGYGDRYPVTVGGRITAMFIMIAGVGIIGALASILSSLLVGGGSSTPEEETPDTLPGDGTTPVTAQSALPVVPPPAATQQDIADLKNEVAALRQMLEKMSMESHNQ